MVFGDFLVIWTAIFLITLVLLGNQRSGHDDNYVTLSRVVYDEMLAAVKDPVIYPLEQHPENVGKAIVECPQVPQVADKVATKCDPETKICTGFDRPIMFDIAGIGDLYSSQVSSLQECAKRCARNKRCKSFEYSPTAQETSQVTNCQIASKAAPLAPAFQDFKLYLKNELAGADSMDSRGTEPDYKGTIRISHAIDIRFNSKAAEMQEELSHTHYPSYDQMYKMITNRPYDAEHNIFTDFINPFNMTSSFAFPFSNLTPDALAEIWKKLNRKPRFAIEVGSFHGHSALLQAIEYKKTYPDDPPYLLCIDPFTGDLGNLLYRDDWDKKITPGEIHDGRSTSYWQFMLNVKKMMKDKIIGTKQILPLVTTSIVGARFLKAIQAQPDLIYLDSAHEANEVYFEVSLYFELLAKGGILFGDDFGWSSVGNDVTKFADENGLTITHSGATWYLFKEGSASGGM